MSQIVWLIQYVSWKSKKEWIGFKLFIPSAYWLILAFAHAIWLSCVVIWTKFVTCEISVVHVIKKTVWCHSVTSVTLLLLLLLYSWTSSLSVKIKFRKTIWLVDIVLRLENDPLWVFSNFSNSSSFFQFFWSCLHKLRTIWIKFDRGVSVVFVLPVESVS